MMGLSGRWPLSVVRGPMVALLFAAAPALADDTQLAKEEFQRGTVAYKLGKFEEALSAYERAYVAKPLAAILFNIGQCHYQLKH